MCIPCPGYVWVYAYRHMDAQAYTLAYTHTHTHTYTYTDMQRSTSTHTCSGSHSHTHTRSQICTVSRVCSHRRLYFPVLAFVKPQFKLEEELSNLKSVAGYRSECGHRRAQTSAACHALSPTSLGGCCPLHSVTAMKEGKLT